MHRKRILIVDDEEVTRLFARQTLEAAGFDVEEAEDGLSGLAALSHFEADLIILDVLMPVMDGFAMCESLRRLAKHRHTPVLMVTGLDDPESVERAYQAGATDFVTKPISWPLLRYRVQYVLRATGAIQQLAKNHVVLANAQRLAGLSTWDWEHGPNVVQVSGELFGEREFGDAGDSLSFDDFCARIHDDDRQRVLAEVLRSVESAGTCRVDCRFHTQEGQLREVHLQAETLIDIDGQPLSTRGTLQDITQRKQAELQVRRLAFYDALTGLPNRMFFKEELSKAVQRAARDGFNVALLFLDVDNFKRVNDSLGHDAGDQLLRAIASRLETCVRREDMVSHEESSALPEMVARLGGDEFTILLGRTTRAQDAGRVADRILQAFAEPIQLGERELIASTSIGIAVCPADGDTAETLLKHADTAMYAAKQQGRNRYQFYNRSMNETALARLDLDREMRQGLGRGEFLLHYQPRVDARSNALLGYEALIRWNHPSRGVMPLSEFLPAAEESRFIAAIGAWALDRLCWQARVWQNMGAPAMPVALNLSNLEVRQKGLAATIRETLARHALEPRCLQVEIMESSLTQDAYSVFHTLRDLSAIGVSIAIDGFGTGFSSLSHLRHIPVRALKIDRSFARDIQSNSDSAAIAKAVISLAQSLEIGVIADGVETEAARDCLMRLGCYEMQGPLFGELEAHSSALAHLAASRQPAATDLRPKGASA